jgi:hypothetical protein
VHLDLSKKYCEVAANRVEAELKQLRLDDIAPATAPSIAAESKGKYTTRKKPTRK